MKFSFGIITSGNESARIQKIIESIENQNIPNYEIIIIGNDSISGNNIISLPFDESQRPAKWITKKKNMITEIASYENIVYTHDYFSFLPGWYDGFLKFGNDFEVCVNKLENFDGTRYADWCLDALLDVTHAFGDYKNKKVLHYDMIEKVDLTSIMYISGGYWVAKKEFMQKVPLNEYYFGPHPIGEDVEWSHRAREHTKFLFNANSICKIIKPKRMGLSLITEETKSFLLSMNDNQLKQLSEYTKSKMWTPERQQEYLKSVYNC